jgi:uncharacterized protein (TIGR00661 family)
MRILYGVQGTGNGHITRARHMAEGFAKRDDIHVDYLFSGRRTDQYFDMQGFADYNTARGFTFETANGRICRRKTVKNNNVLVFAKEVQQQMLRDYDLLINDFEPVSAWAAKLSGLPSLSVSHQAAFLHQVPKHEQGLLDKALTRYFAPTQHSLGTHWYHFGHQIIPPFVSQALNDKLKSTHETAHQQVLVYLPFENTNLIEEHLLTLSDYQFICYHPSVKSQSRLHNVTWKVPSNTAFKEDLVKSAGVIANCGFELSTECLSLGKALLVKPLKGQFEQLSNAQTLKQLGLCKVMHSINTDEIDEWLQSKVGIQIDFPNSCDGLIEWISQGNWHSPDSICKQLWQQVKFPETVRAKLYEYAPSML